MNKEAYRKKDEKSKNKKLVDCLKYTQPSGYIVSNTVYQERGIPVLTAGKTFVLGFTDEEHGIFKDLPVIIFDDFTTESKFVSFPFKVKSSAMKLLKEKNNNIVLKFVFEHMQLLKFPSIGGDHKRRWISEFQNLKIYLPPFNEQKKIAEILETIDEEIEKTDEIIKKYERIKNGLMQDLFSKGITAFQFEGDKLIQAVTKAFKNGDHKFGREENLVGHLKEYLYEQFPDWTIDGEVEKNNQRQRPDIIIHKRGTDENLFAIEVKKNDNIDAIKQDIKKLEDVMLGDYHYEDAVFIGFNIENTDEIFELSDNINFILVTGNGEIKTKSRVRKFKDSPLGKIPEEWEVIFLDEIAEITSSKRVYYSEYVDEGIPFYRSKEIIDRANGEYPDSLLYITLDRFNYLKQKYGIPKSGDILITAVGTLGIIYIIKESDYFYFKDGNLLWLKDFKKNISKKYLSYIFTPLFCLQGKILRIGSSQQALTIEKLKKMRVFLPSFYEQYCISMILSNIDGTINRERNYKQKIKRIKQGLMEDLLTGKVRVNHLIEEDN